MKKFYFLFQLATLRKLSLLVCLVFFAIGITSFTANAQVVVTENFNVPSTLAAGLNAPLPAGWITLKISGTDPDSDWDETNPYNACCPFIGAGPYSPGGPATAIGNNCAEYDAMNIALAGNATGLVTPPYDLSARGASASNVSFEFFRSAGNAALDNIQVYANTIPSMSGATLLTETATSSNIIYRNWSTAPVAIAINNWNNYTYALPAAFNTSSTYIIIVGTAAGAGASIYIDDFSIDTYPSAMTYVSSELFFQNTSTVASGSVNAMVIGINIKMDGSLSPVNCDSLLLVPNGTTDLTNISNARMYYTGNSSSFTTTAQFGAAIAVPGAAPVMKFGSAARPLVNGNNYFWLSYNVTGPAGNFVDADFFGSKLSDLFNVLRIPAPQTLFGARPIGVSYCIPVMSVGTAWANYTNNDYVANVQLTGEVPGPIINSSINTVWSSALPCAAGTCPFTSHPPDYEFFTADPNHTTILKEGGVYFPLTMQVGTWFSSNYLAAWIDWNGDGDFNDVVGGISEKIYQSPSLVGSAVVNTTVTVPANGSPGLVNGNTILRVREVYATSNINPCQGYTYGETEDFVVTITPNCTAGVKTWLGFTSDWNNPANWCDQIPTLADIALIPGNSGTPGYNMPKITPGVNATVKTLRVNSPDTVYVDASSNASLTVADSMVIRGAVHIENGFQGTCPMGNGTFTRIAETPLAGASSDAKMQIIYTAGELVQCGLIPGDVITEIHMPVFRRRNLSPYANFNIKYYHTLQSGYAATTNAVPLTPITTVYTNVAGESLDPIPNFGSGTHPIVLNGAPMAWNGVNNIVVEICFDKVSPLGNFDDVFFHTQTIGRNSILLHRSQPLTLNFTWLGCNAVGPFAPNNYASLISDYRPNLIFKYDRPYTVFPINQKGHWLNNGVFNAGLSNVIFNGGAATQNIVGTSTTTFDELTINKGGTVVQIQPPVVSNIFRLTLGFYDLNQRTVTVTNPSPTAVTRTIGVVLSESFPPNHGVFKWDVGTMAGPHSIPFGNSLGVHLPLSVDQNGGSNIGSIEVATYPTAANNMPFPVGVTHVNGPLAGGDNSANTVDRFWLINQTGGAAVNADITFTYSNAEETSINQNDSKRPQRWVTAIDAWENSLAAGVPFSPIAGARSVLRTGITSLINDPWTISNDVSPLPIELLVFDAEAEKDRSKIWWVTASEVNVDHFTIERTTDGHVYEFIDRQSSNSPSTQMQEYIAYDYAPLKGLQYYRLTSTDNDGSSDMSSLVPVYFGEKGTFEITSIFANSQSGNINILFEYDSSLPLNYVVSDALGRVIATEENLTAKEGTNVITLSSALSQGIYFVTIKNANKITSKKFTY